MKIIPSYKRPAVTRAEAFALAFCGQAGYSRPGTVDYIYKLADTAPLGESPLHGFRHWLTVLDNGLQIIEATPALQTNAMRSVIILFALFHDIRREGEGECTEHGKAGAMFLQSIHRDEIVANLGGSYEAIKLAAFACECHTIVERPSDSILLREGTPSPIGGKLSAVEVMLVGACLDADRLDLGRVGIRPHPHYLTTDAAKQWACKQ